MTRPVDPLSATRPQPILPAWIFHAPAPEALEDAAFSSGAALALLHILLQDPSLGAPRDLLRSRLALRAAASSLNLEGRGRSEAEIRDAYHLTAPGDAKGPAGEMAGFWRAGAALRLNGKGWRDRLAAALPEALRGVVAEAMDDALARPAAPAAQAVAILARIIAMAPRQEAAALLAADCGLAKALGWERPLPLIALAIKRRALRDAADGADIRIAGHAAIARAARDAIRLAHDLARRAALLRAAAPKLRAKGAAAAVALFLAEEAVYPPTMLTPRIKGSEALMTDRAARRLCDRLVELGAVRELSGRKTFRLYGVA